MAWSFLNWEKKKEGWINPAEGMVTSSCGVRENPVLNKIEFHNGIDIAVVVGTEVAAVRSGVVRVVRTSETFGKVLEYETEDGYKVMYAHLSDVLVKPGEKIKQGEIVAKSGNTGLSTGPHLHYSLWKDGKLIDPLSYVTLEYTQEVEAEYAARGESI
ncbi:M23 family metallopeptidase [Anaerotignum sp.]|uniref:M23 family metallopeptidase n=1 Tax=Anaerotignum sp. TaxID=2039241 RepID=UPI0033193823